jgi:hypothetical protein
MMDEWNQAGKADGKERNLDTRLEAFYGPALSEQPLPESSWLKLHSRLDARKPRQRRMSRRWHYRRYTGRGRVPLFIQGAFTHIMYEARIPYNASMLHCVIKPRISVPEVRISLLPRRQIGLFLSSPLEGSVDPTTLDVLLATGLARYVTMRRANYILPRLLLVSVVLFASAILIQLHWSGVPSNAFLIAIGLYIVLSIGVVWVMGRQRRTMAVRADSLMVQWLGRGRACQGLRALADWSRAPSRKKWGELSITERIGRVCGTQVSLEQERLTLVK